jgi:pimeloyl-ACP methyl ester carboxylesterase
MGASIAWRYTQSHLDDVVGLVTVDGMPPDFANLKSLGMNALDGPMLRFLLLCIERLGITPLLYTPPLPPIELSPTEAALWERERFLSTGFFGTLLSIDSIVRSATTMGPLGDLPLIVIARRQPGSFFDPLGERKDGAEAMWSAMQAGMAGLSGNSELRVAERSDHDIAMRQPEIVVEAIRDLVAGYREGW